MKFLLFICSWAMLFYRLFYCLGLSCLLYALLLEVLLCRLVIYFVGLFAFVVPFLFKHMMVVDLWFFSIVPIFNLSLTTTKMVDVKKECNVEFYHILSQYSSHCCMMGIHLLLFMHLSAMLWRLSACLMFRWKDHSGLVFAM